MRVPGFKRVLFVVNRNHIKKQTLKSLRKVFNGKGSMGWATGEYPDYDKDYIFATVQTISKDDNLKRFSKDNFNTIIIDEAHHSAAYSYKKIMGYFKPRF